LLRLRSVAGPHGSALGVWKREGVVGGAGLHRGDDIESSEVGTRAAKA